MRWMSGILGAVLLVAVWAMPTAAVWVNLQDEQGRPLLDATIRIFNRETGNIDTANTDPRGRFQLFIEGRGADEPGGFNTNDNVLIVGQGVSDGSVSIGGNHVASQGGWIELTNDTITVRNIQQHGAFRGPTDPPPFATCGPGPCDRQTIQIEIVALSLRSVEPITVQIGDPRFGGPAQTWEVNIQVDTDQLVGGGALPDGGGDGDGDGGSGD